MTYDIENQEENIATVTYDIIKKKHEREISYFNCIFAMCSFCSIGVLVLGIIGGSISYLVFGIMFLVEDYPRKSNECNDLNLWVYVLVCVILSFNRFMVRSNKENKSSESTSAIVSMIVCKGFIELGLSIWGGVEVFNSECDDTNLWKFALATFIIQLSLATICLLFVPLGYYCLTYLNKPN